MMCLVLGAISTPIAIVVALAFAALLIALGDETGGSAVRAAGIVLGLLWVVDLIALLIALGFDSLARGPSWTPDDAPDSERLDES